MKRVKLVMLILAGIFLVSGVYAAPITCSDPSQVMFRLSAETNAHGEIYNGAGNYNVEVCYDDFFAPAYGGATPHQCSGSNILLKLSSNTNAHAEGPSGTNYNTNVCYGDLSCSLIPTGNSCGATETTIAYLSSQTNAHISLTDNSYPYKLCCSSSGIAGGGDINSVQWNDMAGNVISSSYLGNKVRLVANTGLSQGSTVTFDIFDEDGIADDSIKTGLIASVDASGKAVYEWQITSSDMTTAGIGGAEGSAAEFYFIASGGSGSATSGILSVENSADPIDNFPNAQITSPANGAIYFVNDVINFAHSSSDQESSVSVSWNFGDGTSSTQNSPTKSYGSAGTYTIILTATDESGQKDEDERSILVVSQTGDAVRAYIEKPKHKEAVVSPDLSVLFKGEESYVVSVSSGVVTCLAGNCPTTTGSGASIGGTFGNFGQMFYTWTIKEGTSQSTISGLSLTTGNAGFSSTGIKMIELLLNYPGQSGSLSDSFTREFVLYDQKQCNSDGTVWSEIDGQGNIISEKSTLTTGACMGANQVVGGGDDCCPIGWSCTTTGCELSGSGANIECSVYTTQTECEEDALRAVESDPLWSYYECGTTSATGENILCECAWVGGASGSCGFKVNKRSSTDTTGGYATCTYETISEGECVNGVQEITLEEDCGSGISTITENVFCGQHQVVQLPFFTFTNVLLTLAVLAGIYLIIIKKKN
jgi:PKD repeat protein